MKKIDRKEGIDREHTHHLACETVALQDYESMEAESRTWPLKIYTLSRFNLIRDGKKVALSGKVQQKPLTMLEALIALGGRNIRAPRIIDLIWPDIERDLSLQSFKTTLHRLRRLLDLDQAILFQEGCLSV